MAQTNGTIHHIGKPEQITDNFTKRNFILITDQQTNYPQYIQFQLVNQKTSLIDRFREGDQVSVDYNLRGRLKKDSNTESFNQLEAWKIEKV